MGGANRTALNLGADGTITYGGFGPARRRAASISDRVLDSFLQQLSGQRNCRCYGILDLCLVAELSPWGRKYGGCRCTWIQRRSPVSSPVRVLKQLRTLPAPPKRLARGGAAPHVSEDVRCHLRADLRCICNAGFASRAAERIGRPERWRCLRPRILSPFHVTLSYRASRHLSPGVRARPRAGERRSFDGHST